MNDQILQKLLEYLQNTEDFVMEQIPDIVLQALKYEKISSYLSASLMMVLLTIAIVVCYYFWKHPTLDKYASRDVVSFLGVLIPGIISPILFVQLCSSIDKLVKIQLAPKYFLVQLLAQMKS